MVDTQVVQNHYVMDFETMVNLFCAVFIHYKTDEKKVFIIHDLKDDTEEFLEFLDHNKRFHEWHISFNGLHFDSQITEAILKKKDFINISTKERLTFIYATSQAIIKRVEQWPEYPEWKLSIKQIDVFKINHWDNANKRSSLKWIECMIDWDNVQEMPIHHTTEVHSWEDINMIVDYCINDVLSTKKVYNLSRPLLEVRMSVKKKYNLPCINYSNTKLGSELLLKLYCDLTGREKRIVKEYRTNRTAIPIGPIIFPYIEFKSHEMIGFHEMIKKQVITNTKDGFKYSLKYKGYVFEYGLGGIHQCIKPGVYVVSGNIIIKDWDVGSLYPNLACQNGMFPAHLGPEFFQVYKEEIVDVRMAEKAKPKAERDMAIIEGFKEASNASYGNSNQIHSWLYDPQYTMQTTINGQLSVTMLVEDLLIHVPEAVLLQTNTDGATFMFDKQHLPVYNAICKRWEKLTKLTLEYADYKAMYIWDVNNYFVVKGEGDYKCKGRFEWEEFVKYKYTHLHKNKSYLVVAKAVFEFFVHNIIPEDYLKSNRNIFDYCAFAKLKGNWIFKQTCIVDGEVQRTTLQKTLRYYVSTNGCKITKKNVDDGREIQLEAGKWVVTDYCKANEIPWEEYQINDTYYLEQIYAEIEKLVPKKSAQTEIQWPV